MDFAMSLTYFHDSSGLLIRHHHGEVDCYGQDSSIGNPLDEWIPRALASDYRFVYACTPEMLYGALIKLPNSNDFLSVGPVFLSEPTFSRCEKVLKSMNLQLTPDSKYEFINWLQSFQYVSLLRFLGFIKLLNYTITEADTEAVHLEWPKNPNHDYTYRPAPIFFKNINEVYELRLLKNIEYGHIHEAKIIIDRLELGRKKTYDKVIGIRYYQKDFIQAAALASRAAVRGGLNYALSLSLSDEYVDKMYSFKSKDEILIYIRHMLMDFVYRTAMCNDLNTDSILVKRINSVIQQNINDQISTAKIADELHKNASYLSKHFKEETGVTITSYIQQKKITEAKRLLQTSDKSIKEVASLLDFSSQSYFNQVFKKITGITPVEFQHLNL